MHRKSKTTFYKKERGFNASIQILTIEINAGKIIIVSNMVGTLIKT